MAPTPLLSRRLNAERTIARIASVLPALVALALAPSAARAQSGNRAEAAFVDGCPFAVRLPGGWKRVPLTSARRDETRSMRIQYGADVDYALTIMVRFSDRAMSEPEWRNIERNRIMSAQPDLMVAGKRTAVLRAPLQPGAGTDTWQLYRPFDDEDDAVITVSVFAARGHTLPGTELLRTVMSTLVPGACLSQEDEAPARFTS